MEMHRTLVTPDGAALGYRLWRGGTAPRRLIVLLHGVASNMTRWSEFVEFTTLKRGWDILRLDLARGLSSGGRWQLVLSVHPELWDML
jgi:alpha-beta hydrolase superfamily lysophospholipase